MLWCDCHYREFFQFVFFALEFKINEFYLPLFSYYNVLHNAFSVYTAFIYTMMQDLNWYKF